MNNNNQNKQTNGQAPVKNNSNALVITVIAVVIIILGVWLAFEKGKSGAMSGMASSTMLDMTGMSTSTIPAPSAAPASAIPSSISNGTSTIGVALTQVPFIYVISTDKKVYSQNDQINIIIAVINNTSASSTFNFKNGCEGNYTIAGFDLSKHILCTAAPKSFTVAPHNEADVSLTHYPSVAILPVGTWPLYASIPGYGGATTTVTITN